MEEAGHCLATSNHGVSKEFVEVSSAVEALSELDDFGCNFDSFEL